MDQRGSGTRNRTLGGRYQLEAVIGTGGVAEVWRATDHRLGRTVAVKLLAGPAARDPSHRMRIEREARALAAVSHPNVVAVFDYAEEPAGDDPLPYLVLELIEGPDLARFLAERGPLPSERAVEIVGGILDGVHQAHGIGVVHGDLKPANVFLGPEGPKVGDFGVARILSEETGNTRIAATPTYAAPEVLQGSRPTPASDVYSAACVAYEALAGRPPFDGKTFWDVANQHIRADAVALSVLRSDIDPRLADAVAIGLSREPSERPSSAAAFAALLREAIADPAPETEPARELAPTLEATQPEPAPEPPTVPVVPTATEALPRVGPRRVLRRARAVPIGVAAAALAVIVLAVLQGRATATARTPELVGMQVEGAAAAARSAGFDVDRVTAERGGIAGSVVAQDPLPGSLRERGSTIVLTVTKGAPQVEVPDVTRLAADDARAAIEAADLVAGDVSYQASGGADPGTVIRTIPAAGTSVDEGSAVHVIAAALPARTEDADDKPGKGTGRDRED